METQAVTITVPSSVAEELHSASQDFLVDILVRGLHTLRIEQALQLYGQGGISLAAAAEKARVSQAELARYAYAHGMEPPFSAQTLVEELG